MKRPWIVLGGGGHARVVVDVLRACGAELLGFTDRVRCPDLADGVPWLGGEDALAAYPADSVYLAVGVGAIGDSSTRRRLFLEVQERGYECPPLKHPRAVVSPDAQLAEGAQVMAGAVIQPGCRIGPNSIINTRASVDHDCVIGAYVHVAPGATLSGGVVVGDGAHIGVGATVIQGVHIGASSVVGAGAVVLSDPCGATVVGVPAKPMKR